MQIVRLIVLLGAFVCGTIYAEDTKTFPGAEIIIPAIIGQVLPVIIGGIIGGGGGPTGGGGANLPALPPVSISHTTSVATSVANKPIAVSHSGSLSTSSNTNAGSQAIAGQGSMVSATSGSGTNPINTLSVQWRKFFKNIS
ncbi:probable serine/threonine-protein kinase DDB_G0272282 isoform X2 [Wyeomyia smithii]|uniref:probable serine/threonine-protein kinase DDB_G0272282 isoform X2 n=1 Tax=Wyeomyia smithii TaxID=174621 RepID=UPI002467DAD9|nr:probable serine/threonine-protein kinase DDB_G0272282 isoform X2 [Wyeomyia smithii]